MTTVRAAAPGDRGRVAAFLEERGMRPIARLGELLDPLDGEALLAEDPSGALAGVLTYRRDGVDCEVTTLYAAARWQGVGSALLAALDGEMRATGCRRVWLITTNDNVDGLRFYQRRGFRLAELYAGAVDDSRARRKPSIPEIGDHGIPIRDEIVLERSIE